MIHLMMVVLMLFLVPMFLLMCWSGLGFGKWGLLVSLFGNTLNILALAFNGWQMPVIGYFIYPETLWKSGLNANLPWICDRFPVLIGVCSIGDFIIFAGAATTLAWVIQRIAREI